MKIERINENKIRVTLSISDLKERNIDFKSLSHNSPQAQELFWDMMHQAEIEYGFSSSNAQLFIEASPDSVDNLVITVTRVEDDEDFESIHKYIRSKFKKSELKVKKKSKKLSSGILIYSFEDFEDVCSISKLISNQYCGENTLYKHGKIYYLVLANTSLANTDFEYFDSIMIEYGNRVTNTAFVEGYLNEHSTKMIDFDAIAVISDYFN